MNPLPFHALISLAFTAAAMAAAPSQPMPNIVYILADDLGYGDVHCFDPERGRIPTPNMDRLAREGLMMTDAHSGSAVCTPTRYGVLTGRYAWRTRLQSGVLWGLSGPLITSDRLTVGELLRRQGYETAAFGKWHLGMDWPGGQTDAAEIDDVRIDYARPIRNGPITRGFDSFFGISASLDMAPYVSIADDRTLGAATVTQREWYRPGPAAPDFHAVDAQPEFTRRIVDYIRQRPRDARPFFVYFPLSAPHTPIVPAAAWRGRSGLGEYGDFVMQVDGVVGEIMTALEQSGLAENTLVILTSDNGCPDNPAGAATKAADLQKRGHFSNGSFRGYKSDIWEGGHRVPFIVRWPARIPAGSTSERTICLTDFLATAAELTGAAVPADAGEDSVSFLPTLLGRKQPPRTAVVHHSISGHFAIRDGKWKLILARGSGGWSSPTEAQATALRLPPVQLYDLAADPGERHNLAAENPAEVERLTTLLARFVAEGRSTPGPLMPNDVPVEIQKTNIAPPVANPKDP